MLLRSGASRRAGSAAFAGLVAALVVASISPAEARRHHNRGVQGYNPPFAAMVVDAKTGKTLYARNEDALRHPASITKVMTLYLLFEQLEKGRFRLDSPLKITAHAAAQAPSKLGLDEGDTISVEEAIKAIVTKSANDIAAAIGENIAGSETAFADMMTRKAKALGMSRTVFVNASGLPDPEQVTTAHDLTILARAIQERFPRYYAYFATPSFRYGGAVIRNHNRLLGRVQGVDGIKTGYTRMSGFNLMTNARSDGHHIVAVVLGGRSGATRDRIMASLVAAHLPRAFAGAKTAPMVAEAAPEQANRGKDNPKPGIDLLKVAGGEPNKSPSLFDARKSAAPEKHEAEAAQGAGERPNKQSRGGIDLSNVRPVFASDPSLSTATPSAFRWIAGPQGAARGEGRAQGDGAHGQVKGAGPLAEPKASDAKALDAKALDVRSLEEHGKRPTETAVKDEPRQEARSDERIDTRPTGSTGWVIQLGAPDNEAKAKELLAAAKSATGALRHASAFTEKVVKGNTTLWRARFSGFDPDAAQAACKALKRSGFDCFATKG